MRQVPFGASLAPFSHPGWQIGPGLLIAGSLLALTIAGVAALLCQAPLPEASELWQNRYLSNVIRFTVWQATLSTGLSLVLGLVIALVLVRQPRFPGRGLLLRMMELSLVLPTIVAVSGLVGVYGRHGWLTSVIDHWTTFGWNLYGLNGIVLAHIFFNAPLAGRILLQALESVPAPRRRVASQLGLQGWWLWRTLDWPAVSQVLPGLAALVFTLCFTSFAIVMTLGGGPASTTLEVAIYQSLRFEFDFGRAALLAIVQLLICGAIWLLMVRRGLSANLTPQRSFPETILRPDSLGLTRFRDVALLLCFTLFLLLPLAAILVRGMPGLVTVAIDGGNPLADLANATLRSFAIALPAGALSVLSALLVRALASRGGPHLIRLSSVATAVPLMVPPIVLGTGLFLLLRPSLGHAYQGLALVALINGLMALPFVTQLLRGPLTGLDEATTRQADQLGLLGWYRWRWLHWPRLRRPLALAMAYGTGLSLGDFGVIALFGSPGQPTVPVLLYQQLGSYRMELAAGTALWLVTLLLLVFAAFNLPGYRRKQSRHQQDALKTLAEARHA
ncbi:MAG: thiamine/thiamine pyrophosphate ABC transporter, permease protein [Marinobacter sp.]|nr:thiamine/thiamine pyrophosphate ABC transporter, permease protein [Marinobacter sp.]